IHYDGLYKSAALVNLTQKKMLFKNDVASLDAIFGDNFRYFFNYYVDNGYLWSVGVQSKLNTLNRSIEFNDYVFEDFPELKAFTTKYIDLTNRLYFQTRSEEHTSELQSRENLVCRLLLEKKKKTDKTP